MNEGLGELRVSQTLFYEKRGLNVIMEVKVMNQYVTGAVIKKLREKNKMTQLQLAERLGVSDKTISKWETGV